MYIYIYKYFFFSGAPIYETLPCHPCRRLFSRRFGWLVGNEEWNAAEASETWGFRENQREPFLFFLKCGSKTSDWNQKFLWEPADYIQTSLPHSIPLCEKDFLCARPVQRRRWCSTRGFGISCRIRFVTCWVFYCWFGLIWDRQVQSNWAANMRFLELIVFNGV